MNIGSEMQEISSNNKRIAKNTLLLYFRMLVTMAVSLYTSRVVLNILGVEDFGIYNVVGGIVAMFGFINGSMTSATQRYLTFELGQNNRTQLTKVFSTSLSIHAIISFLIIVLAETVGLWFLWNKMQIPADRMNAAFWVFQCSVAASVIMIMSVPYNAAIIAHERMSAFAYISIIEVSLKLLIVCFLRYFHTDKLILYAALIVIVQLVIRLCYSWYCNRHFKETKYRWIWDKTLFCEMTGFAGWNLFGNLAAITFTQGLNLLLNMFFGPVVNAARGIAVQAQTAIGQFSSNFQTALNPQITKSYATGDMEYMHGLIFRSAKFSFFLLLLLSLPVASRDKSATDTLAENRPGRYGRIFKDHAMHNMDICNLQSFDDCCCRHGENKTLPKRRRRAAAADPADFLRLSEMRIACIRGLCRSFRYRNNSPIRPAADAQKND